MAENPSAGARKANATSFSIRCGDLFVVSGRLIQSTDAACQICGWTWT
jgi:hypothetical protein